MADLKIPPRIIDDELGVPMPAGKPLPRRTVSSENDVLAVLAENYRLNPGLHMTMADIKELLDVSDEDLNAHLLSIEEKDLASLFRDQRGTIALARATYKGLDRANAPEHYKHIPSWVNQKDIF